jgi:hypothetical protein
MTSPATAPRRASRKPLRFVTWLARLAAGNGLLQVRLQHSETRQEIDRYFILPVPSDFGTAFKLERWDEATDDMPAHIGAVYFCHLPGPDYPGSCECKGWLKHGHCKHIESLQKLIEDDKL